MPMSALLLRSGASGLAAVASGAAAGGVVLAATAAALHGARAHQQLGLEEHHQEGQCQAADGGADQKHQAQAEFSQTHSDSSKYAAHSRAPCSARGSPDAMAGCV